MDFIALPPDFLVFVLALVAAGLIAGFLAGLFGIGGGGILVPVFYQMFGELGIDESVRMHLAVGTAHAVIVPTSIRAFYSHLKRGTVDLELLRSWRIVIPAGVVLASIVSIYISGAALRAIFVVFAFSFCVKLMFGKDSWRLGEKLPGNPLRAMVGWLIGFSSTFMGIGGGVMNVTFMTLYGRKLHQAVSTSTGVGALVSLPAAIGYALAGYLAAGDILPQFSVGYVNLLTAALVIPLTLLIAPLGARAAHALPKRKLEVGFAIFLFAVGSRFLYSLVG